MALGVGGTSAVFSVVYSVLLQPLPYRDSDRLVRLWEVHRGARAPVDVPLLTNATYQTWARSSATLESVGAFETGMHAVAALTMRATTHVLFGIAPLDPVAFLVAPLELVVVAVAACLGPAWRAAAIEPVEALSAES